MLSELRHWWKIIRTAILVIGVLLSFLAFVEVLHVYVILRDAYPLLGYAFLLLIATGLIWSLVYVFLNIRKRPKVLLTPNIEDLATASLKECHSYCSYLIQYLERLRRNPILTDEDVNLAIQKIARLEKLIESDRQASALFGEINKIEKEDIESLLSKLDEKAESEVRKCMRDIMLGVTLSPFKAVDLVIVIYRNASMVLRVMKFYNSRPLLAEQILIFRDVFRVVATVNYLNFGAKLMEQFLSRIPYAGQVVDDFAQGVGAGLLTSVTGHGAMFRCRAFKRWDQEIAIQTMSAHTKKFMKDVKDMFKKDVLPRMRNRVSSVAPTDQTADPRFWEKTTNGISSALDATGAMVETFVKKPVSTGTGKTIEVSSIAISKSKEVLSQRTDGIRRATKSVASGTGKGVRFASKKLAAAYRFTGRKMRRGR